MGWFLDFGTGSVPYALILIDHWFYVALAMVVWLGSGGYVGKGFGVSNIFRDDRAIGRAWTSGDRYGALISSPALWGHFMLAVFAGIIWIVIFNDLEVSDALRCAASCVWPVSSVEGASFEALMGLLGWTMGFTFIGFLFSLAEILALRVDGSRPTVGEIVAECVRAIVGLYLGVGVIALVWFLAGASRPPVAALGANAALGGWTIELAVVYAAATVLTILLLYRRTVLPCVSMVVLLMAAVLVGGVFDRLGARASDIGDFQNSADEMFFVAVLLWIGWANGKKFKLRIPGFADTLYAKPLNPDTNETLDGKKPGAAPGYPVPMDEPLDRWLTAERERRGPDWKPKVVLLATSGGAYRASFWTSLVLDALIARSGKDGPLDGAADAVRLVTGASGGMVAGAYFVAMVADDGPPSEWPAPKGESGPVTGRIEEDVENFQKKIGRRVPVPRDSLAPVVQQLVARDLLRMAWPFRSTMDRGRMLEAQWDTLDRDFASLVHSERGGRAPSIILSPMLVESGAPAFISNLDLAPLRSRGLNPEESPEEHINDESVEIFDAFPTAHSGLTLGASVRLNATFPFVSPAVSLPTWPTRRVVDAGYYDNYGVDLAAAWLMTPRVIEVLRKHEARVAVIECRAFPSGGATGSASRLARAFRFLTSPLEGVFKARSSSQMFRNSQQLRLAEAHYDGRLRAYQPGAAPESAPLQSDAGPEKVQRGDNVASFVFEADVDASMNWYLPDDEIRALRSLIDPSACGEALHSQRMLKNRARIADEFAALEAFWARG